MTAIAHVIHQLPGRVRLRVSGRRNETAFFDQLSADIAQCGHVLSVEVNPSSASVLVLCEQSPLKMLAEIEGRGLLAIMPKGAEPSESQTLLTQIAEKMKELEEGILSYSFGRFDLGSLLFVMLLVLAVVQATRGHGLSPASSLLLSAFAFLPLKK
jgi:hypothetical protein